MLFPSPNYSRELGLFVFICLTERTSKASLLFFLSSQFFLPWKSPPDWCSHIGIPKTVPSIHLSTSSSHFTCFSSPRPSRWHAPLHQPADPGKPVTLRQCPRDKEAELLEWDSQEPSLTVQLRLVLLTQTPLDLARPMSQSQTLQPVTTLSHSKNPGSWVADISLSTLFYFLFLFLILLNFVSIEWKKVPLGSSVLSKIQVQCWKQRGPEWPPPSSARGQQERPWGCDEQQAKILLLRAMDLTLKADLTLTVQHLCNNQALDEEGKAGGSVLHRHLHAFHCLM